MLINPLFLLNYEREKTDSNFLIVALVSMVHAFPHHRLVGAVEPRRLQRFAPASFCHPKSDFESAAKTRSRSNRH